MIFSIVIPLYNKDNHIKRAITSVLQQTYQEFEIIVVDDGSTDNSYQEAKKVVDSRLKVLKKNNGGVSSARNYGIKHSSYDFIAFLDADDEWESVFLESIYNLIQKFPFAGAFGTAYKFIKPSGKEIVRKSDEIVDDNNLCTLSYFLESLETPIITASSVVIPKKVFKTVGKFQEGITRGEDLDMWRRIALKYEVAFINTVCVTYYLDAANRSNEVRNSYNKSSMQYVEELLDNERKHRENNVNYEEYLISKVINKARYFIERNKSKEARKILLKCKHTKYNKQKWLKTYVLSFKTVYFLYKKIR